MTDAKNWHWRVEEAATEITEGVWLLDLGFQNRKQIVASYLLTGDDEVVLIESGPSSTLDRLEASVARAGFDLADVSKVLVTHIHLDHAGASGPLARANPDLRVYAHPFGLPHLVDPTKLVASASRIYGDQMEPLWGDVVAIDEHQVIPFSDDEILRIAGRDLRVIFTPGHAWHHVAIHEADTGTVFTGDVGAVRMPGYRYVCPPAPPPDLSPDSWAESIERIAALNPTRLCLTHFGVVDDPARHLEQILPNLEAFMAIGEAAVNDDEPDGVMTRKLQDRVRADLETDDPEVFINYEWAAPAYMAAMGIRRYLKKQAEQ